MVNLKVKLPGLEMKNPVIPASPQTAPSIRSGCRAGRRFCLRRSVRRWRLGRRLLRR